MTDTLNNDEAKVVKMSSARKKPSVDQARIAEACKVAPPWFKDASEHPSRVLLHGQPEISDLCLAHDAKAYGDTVWVLLRWVSEPRTDIWVDAETIVAVVSFLDQQDTQSP